jgi:hypothetical protein
MKKLIGMDAEHKTLLNRAIDLIHYSHDDSDEERRAQLESGIQILSTCLDQYPDDSELLYDLGYATYMLPQKSLAEWRTAINFLVRCIRLNPHHQFALYYLACVLFDRRRFKTASHLLKQIDSTYFGSIEQEWRSAHVCELIACADFYCGNTARSAHSFQKMITAYDSVSDPDWKLPPTALCQLLDTAIKEQLMPPEDLEKLARSVAKLLQDANCIGVLDWYESLSTFTRARNLCHAR